MSIFDYLLGNNEETNSYDLTTGLLGNDLSVDIPKINPQPTQIPLKEKSILDMVTGGAEDFYDSGSRSVNYISDLNQKAGDAIVDFGGDAYEGILGPLVDNWYGNLSEDAGGEIQQYDEEQGVLKPLLFNFKTSFANEFKGLIDASLSPVQTSDAIASVISGAVQHSLPDDMSWNEDSKKIASQIADIYADRYGSVEGFKKSFAEEPVPVLLELLGVGLITKLAAAKSLSALKGIEMGQAVEQFTDKAVEMASLGTIKDGGRMKVIDDGLLGQTPVKYPKTLRGNIMRLTDESDKLKELRGTDITQRTLDRISDIEAEIFELAPLIVQHNLDSSGLLLMDEMGGTPMPSMAISKVEHPLIGFGDISLLGDSDMAIPSAKNPIHDADTYSGRQPRMFTQYADVDSVYKMVDNNKDISHFSDFWIFDAQDAADLEIKLSIVEGMKAQGFNPKNYKSYSAMKTDFWEKTGKSSYDLAEEFKIDSLGEIEQVFTPNPMYTPSGNRKKLRPYSLDEVHKQMKKDKAWIPGTEVPTGSAGRARAMSTNLFKTITEIKNSRGRLASHDDMKTIKADFERVYLSVFEPIESIPEVAKRIKDTEYSEMFINGLIDDVLNGDSSAWADLSAETVDIVRKIILPIKRKADDIQTEYFEIKPKGTKKLTDFKGAIIPRHETTAEKILRKNGITKIFKYATEKERQGYFKKFPELMFSKFAVPIGGGLLGGEEEEQSEEGEGLLNINTKEAAPMTGVLDGIKSLPKEIMDIVNVKNNNLGNIKLNKKNDWDGQTNTGSKDTFANFTTPEYGVRALVKVVNANLRATNSYETYVNRYASEPKERAYYKKHGKLMKHLQNYAKVLAKSQGVKNTKSKPKDVDMFKWIIATAKAEGSTKSLQYFTDDVINKGIKMVTQKSK